jgi:hypothetical protein
VTGLLKGGLMYVVDTCVLTECGKLGIGKWVVNWEVNYVVNSQI